MKIADNKNTMDTVAAVAQRALFAMCDSGGRMLTAKKLTGEILLRYYPRESDGICFHRRWFVCVSVCDHDN